MTAFIGSKAIWAALNEAFTNDFQSITVVTLRPEKSGIKIYKLTIRTRTRKPCVFTVSSEIPEDLVETRTISSAHKPEDAVKIITYS